MCNFGAGRHGAPVVGGGVPVPVLIASCAGCIVLCVWLIVWYNMRVQIPSGIHIGCVLPHKTAAPLFYFFLSRVAALFYFLGSHAAAGGLIVEVCSGAR